MKNLIESTKTVFYKAKFSLIKHSPTILTVGGVVLSVGALIYGCTQTKKAVKVIEETAEKLDDVRPDVQDEKQVLTSEQKKEMADIYADAGVKLTKIYAPVVLTEVASLACFIFSHRILSKRNFALAAAYATLNKKYSEYKSRVIDKVGEEEEDKIAHPVEQVITKDPETGEETCKYVRKGTGYEVLFDEHSDAWTKDPDYNYSFIKSKEALCNVELRKKGFLLLNTVYEELGLPKTPAGQVIGWVVKPGKVNEIKFKLSHDDDESKGIIERSYLIDFNVDGYILDNIPGEFRD